MPESTNNYQLTAISSIDGRYRDATAALAEYFSEFALIRARIFVECKYLIALSGPANVGMRSLTAAEGKTLENLWRITVDDARVVKQIEREGYEGIPATNHDGKAVEYFLKRKLAKTSLVDLSEWVHFAITSEDTDNIAYATLLGDAIEGAILPALEEIREALDALAIGHADTPMLARTHGQSASPTTFGKEIRVFEARVKRQIKELAAWTILVKFSGATGNWSAHVAAVPAVDWREFSKKFVEGFNVSPKTAQKKSTGVIRLELNDATTQVEPHDTYAELFDNLRRVNVILMDLSQDIWRYISDGWLTQKAKKGEVGSSTMPHKVNPIDFENAEGNFGVANSLFTYYSQKLPISRLQRDLSDSTVKRTFGTAFAHTLIACKALTRGLGKINVNVEAMREALDEHPEVIAEALQTILRSEGVDVPYEQLKELTRGRKVSLDDFAEFIDRLKVDDKTKKRLKSIRPENYIGLAEKIARKAS